MKNIKKQFIIFDNEESERLDKFIASLQIDELYSRTIIDKLIMSGMILVNDKPVKKSYALRKNDQIEINIAIEPEPTNIIPQKIDFGVLYEDEFLAVIDKPAGLTVHPAKGNHDKTLVNGLVHYFGGQLSDGYETLRPGIVHRLDKDTSGVLLIAKNNKMQARLSSMFQNHEITKKYKTITVGVPKEIEGTIQTNFGRSKKDRKKMAVLEDGKEAITRYKVIHDFTYFSYIDIKLITGRTHQIRVHLAHLQCPVLGDSTYSNVTKTINSIPNQLQKKLKYLLANHQKRQALHAYHISFIHPETQQLINIESPLPEDMQYSLKWLEENFGDSQL